MKKALVTYCTGPMMEVAELTRPAMEAYADRHGYTFLGYGNPKNTDHPSWAKLYVLQDALDNGYDWALWLDADVLIVNQEEDILEGAGDEDLIYTIHKPKFFYWLEHPNAGVFAVSNPRVLEEVERTARACPHELARRCWEQVGFLYLLGFDVDWRFEGSVGKWNKVTRSRTEPEPERKPAEWLRAKPVGMEWNYTRFDSRPRPDPVRFAHYCGLDNKTRIKEINEALNARS